MPRYLRDKYVKGSKEMRSRFDKEIRDRFSNYENEYNVFWFFHQYHVKGLLQRVDTTTMLAAVEARVPFLDHELIEFAYSEIPYQMKLRWKSEACKEQAKKLQASAYSEKLDIPKYVLRQTAYAFLPAEVIERKKVGFPVPLAAWEKELLAMARRELQGACWLRESDTVEELLKDGLALPQGNQIMWMFINIQLFCKQYFNRAWEY